MKKYFLLFALILIFSVPACGGKSENQTTPEQNDSDETAETADKDDNNDNDDDDILLFPDFDFPENSDRDPCEAEPCFGILHAAKCKPKNSVEYECVCENGWFWNGEKCAELPECDQRGKTPCKDSTTGLMWSSMYYDNWHQAKCSEISDGGYTDWSVPGISQLMTLVQNCPDFENGGCEASATSKYSRLGDTKTLWSSSIEEVYFLAINFSNASIEAHCNTFSAMMSEMYNMPPYDCYDCFESHDLRCARCDEGYFWYEDKCVKSPCKADSCSDIPHSTGTCYPITPETYGCSCESNYIWKESECISPCENVTCDMPHSDGKCHSHSEISYSCGCEENYFWNSETEKCLNPCEENPCGNDQHSTGKCTPDSSIRYTCECNDDSHWDEENRKCTNKCDAVSCDIPHSTGKCIASKGGLDHQCECSDNYFWNYWECVSPCETASCGGFDNATGECFTQNESLYVCGCNEGYFWYGGERGCENAKPAFGNICTGLRKCLEGETENCMDMNEYSAYYNYSDMYYAERGKCAPQNFSIDSTVPGQETVIENNLGLEWQRNFTSERYTWDEAVDYCDTLSYGGHSDWRLPDLHEIFSVVFNSDMGNLLDWRLFPNASKETMLWTSQLSSEYYDYVWYINSFGSIDYATKSYLANVICVRGVRLPKASFKTTTVGEDAVVTDTTTGLM